MLALPLRTNALCRLVRTVMLMCCLLAASQTATAQDTLYARRTDRFEKNLSWDLSLYDSLVFKKNTLYLYKKPTESGTVSRNSRTYSGVDYWSFTDPGRILYKPSEFSSMDFEDESSTWCLQRSKESEHFIVFWASGYGDDPSTSSTYSFDVDALLEEAEILFDYYADSLGFIIPGESPSTDTYKIIIMAYYQSDWLATGSGYDNVIGALWCNHSALSYPTTIAHEIGHSFQYLVSCDLGTDHGWRWGYEGNGNGSNGWWESCAQWQAYQVYPSYKFSDSYAGSAIYYSYLNLLHEDWRYANYFIQDYWQQLHGQKCIGTMWRETTAYEDPVETYQRMYEVSQEEFNDEIFDYAQRSASWDIDGLRDLGASYVGIHTNSMTQSEDDEYTWTVDSALCPQNYGMNIIRLNNASPGTTISAQFKGLAGSDGYRSVNVDKAGWRYGFCSYGTDGTRDYGQMYSDSEGTATYTVPQECQYTWFVVTGAPTEHWQHVWDDDVTNDEQWPYQVTFDGTNKYGYFSEYPDDYVRKDTTVTMDINLAYSSSSYSYVTVQFDMGAVSEALGLSTEQMQTLGRYSTSNPCFCGVNKDGSYSYTLTSTSSSSYFGHWFNSSGNVVSYSSSSYIYSEIYRSSYQAHIGQYPGNPKQGKTYTIRQAVRYTADDGETYTCLFIINVTMT